MKIARVIITTKCNRNCSYCCNKQQDLMNSAIKIDEKRVFDIFLNYDIVCLTGGEPALVPDLVKNIALTSKIMFRNYNPKPKIYLYSALYTEAYHSFIELVDGIHYTLHEHATSSEIDNFYSMQKLADNWPTKSCRAYIMPDQDYTIEISPKVWKRLEIKPFIKDCPLPQDETLFILT